MNGIEGAFTDRSAQMSATIAKLTSAIDAVSLQCHSLSAQNQSQIDDLANRHAEAEGRINELDRRLNMFEETVSLDNKSIRSDFDQLSSSLVSVQEEVKWTQ